MKHIFLIGMMVTLMTTVAFAADSDKVLDAVVQGMEYQFRADAEPGAAIEDLQADFLQQAVIGSLDQVDTARGTVAILFGRGDQRKAPRLRWEYQTPTAQEIVADGETAWIYLPENNQVIESPIPADDTDNPMVFLTGIGQLSQRFEVKWADPAKDIKGNYRLELKPKQTSAYIERLEMVVAKEVAAPNIATAKPFYPVRSATVFGPSDSRTTLVFRNTQVNQGMVDSQFVFQVPEGVEVVRPDQQLYDF